MNSLFVGLLIIFSLFFSYGVCHTLSKHFLAGFFVSILTLSACVIITMIAHYTYFILIPIAIVGIGLGWFVSTLGDFTATETHRVETTKQVKAPKKLLKQPKTVNGEFQEVSNPQKVLKGIPTSEIVKYVVENGIMTPKE